MIQFLRYISIYFFVLYSCVPVFLQLEQIRVHNCCPTKRNEEENERRMTFQRVSADLTDYSILRGIFSSLFLLFLD